MKKRLLEWLNNPWSVAIVSGLFLMTAAPVVTGFVQLTFSVKSWQVFGASNATGAPGSFLRAGAVYRMPNGERFRVADDLFATVRWEYINSVRASLTTIEGQGSSQDIMRGQSVSLSGACQTVTLMLKKSGAELASACARPDKPLGFRSEKWLTIWALGLELTRITKKGCAVCLSRP
nr:hypothetical protein [Roseinatronobacter monicus]